MTSPVSISDIVLIAPHIGLFLFSLIPLLMKIHRGGQEANRLVTVFVALAGLIFAGVSTLVLNGPVQPMFGGALVRDGISVWTNFTMIVAASATLIISSETSGLVRRQFSEFVFVLLNTLIGMMVLSMSNDLITAFIAIEMMSLGLYMAIMLAREQRQSKEAAFKYFVLGSFASAILLYGISFIYGTVGSTYFGDIVNMAPQLANTNLLSWAGLSLIVVGFAFKVSVFPFHSWTPDVYQGAPTATTAFMATAVKFVSFVVFFRVVLMGGLIGSKSFFDFLQWLAVLTMLVGNIGAIMQSQLKRVLAYSSVAHSGYLMVGLLAATASEDPTIGATGLLFYLITYVVMTFGAFSFVSWMEVREDSAIHFKDLAGLSSRYPLMAVSFSILLLSLTGLPPTLGFFGKFYLFSAALNQGLLWLAVWGVINSVISVYYYLKPIVYMFMVAPDDELEPPTLSGRVLTELAIGFTALIILVVGLLSSPLYSVVHRAVTQSF